MKYRHVFGGILMSTNKELKAAYEKKGLLRKELFEVMEEVLSAQADLKKTKANIINTTDKKALGSNDKEREAYIVSHTIEEVNRLESLETRRRSLDLKYSLICDEIECMHWQIRNEQVAVGFEEQGLRGD